MNNLQRNSFLLGHPVHYTKWDRSLHYCWELFKTPTNSLESQFTCSAIESAKDRPIHFFFLHHKLSLLKEKKHHQSRNPTKKVFTFTLTGIEVLTCLTDKCSNFQTKSDTQVLGKINHKIVKSFKTRQKILFRSMISIWKYHFCNNAS